MPLPVDGLTEQSGLADIRRAISESVDACMNEPTPDGTDVKDKQKWCVAKAYAIAKKNTGKVPGPGNAI